MRRNPLEKQIEYSICRWLQLKGVLFTKIKTVGTYDQRLGRFRKSTNPFYRRGVSDIIGIYKMRPLAIEVKSKKGVLSNEQKLWLEDWAKHGGIAIVARSIDDVAKALGEEIK